MTDKRRINSQAMEITLTSNKDSLWLTVTDLEGGKIWPTVPLISFEVHQKAIRRTGIVNQYQVDQIDDLLDGWHVDIGHRFYGIRVGLWIRLIEDELSISLVPNEIYEDKPRLFRLYSVDILPGLLGVSGGETLLLPINRGVICHPGDKPALADEFLIYGEQDRWELLPTLPVCAAHAADGGFMAMATQGAADTLCRVTTDGQGNGTVGFSFSLRRFWPDPVDTGAREFRFTPIPASADPVVFTAKRLRRHVMEDMGKPTLAQRAAESPEVAYLLQAYIMKLFHGIENEGYVSMKLEKSNPVSFITLLTFAEAKTNLQRIHAAGIDKVLTQSVGWNTRGHDGLYPTRFPVESRLGGEAGFRDLLATGNALGYMMNVHDNVIMAVAKSPDFNPDYVVQDIYGEPLIHGWWGGGIECSHWLLALPDDRLGGHLERVKDLGTRGMVYLDYMGQPLEVNYHPRHGGPRSAFAEGVNRSLAEGRRVFGSVGTEHGFLYNAIHVDHIAHAPGDYAMEHCDPRWPIIRLLDKSVPMWQLTLHGLVVNEETSLSWQGAMRAILFGAHPRDEWSSRPGIHPVLDDDRIRAQKAMYDLAIGKYGYLQTLELTGYQEDGGVMQSTFEDGTTVIADNNKEELFVNGQLVTCPEGLKAL